VPSPGDYFDTLLSQTIANIRALAFACWLSPLLPAAAIGLTVDEAASSGFRDRPFGALGSTIMTPLPGRSDKPSARTTTRISRTRGPEEFRLRGSPPAATGRTIGRSNQTNRAAYFARLDGVVQSAGQHGVGLILHFLEPEHRGRTVVASPAIVGATPRAAPGLYA